MNWIVVVIIIVIAVVSAIAQTIKNQQEKEQTPRRRNNNNNNRANASGVKTGASDMDRFLQEIEKLRKRAADGGDEPKKPTAKPVKTARGVPTVAPTKKSKRGESVPTVAPSRRIEQLPTATVLPPPIPPQPAFPADQIASIASTAPQLSDRPMVSKAAVPAATTAFGKNLFGLLANKQSLPMAVVLQEILGPPKSKQ